MCRYKRVAAARRQNPLCNVAVRAGLRAGVQTVVQADQLTRFEVLRDNALGALLLRRASP